MCEIMQRIIRGIEHWCNARDLRVNPGKSELILFTRKYKAEVVYGQQLQLTKQVKLLVVLLMVVLIPLEVIQFIVLIEYIVLVEVC